MKSMTCLPAQLVLVQNVSPGKMFRSRFLQSAFYSEQCLAALAVGNKAGAGLPEGMEFDRLLPGMSRALNGKVAEGRASSRRALLRHAHVVRVGAWRIYLWLARLLLAVLSSLVGVVMALLFLYRRRRRGVHGPCHVCVLGARPLHRYSCSRFAFVVYSSHRRRLSFLPLFLCLLSFVLLCPPLSAGRARPWAPALSRRR